MTLTVGSLFSGIGGIELGLERAGMKVLWQVENNEWCQKVLTKHWPEVPKYGDVQELSASSLEAVDVIAGGFPCQPVSFAGKREAQADPRWLWPHFARLVDDLRPKYVLVENVPGLRSAGGTDVVTDLAAMGYDCEWGELSAAGVGAPHLRNRVFIVAYPNRQGESERTVDEVEGQGVVVSDSGSVGGGVRSVHTKPSGQEREPSGASESALVRSGDGPSDAEGSVSGGSDVADADDIGWEWRPRIFREAGWRQLADSSQWVAEPDVRGMVTRISERLDRDLGASTRMGSKSDPRNSDEGFMRRLWDDVTTVSTSRGWRQDEQLANELANLLFLLPHETPLGARETAMEAVRYVRGMRTACASAGLLRDSQQPLQEAWQSATEKEAVWLDLAARGGRWLNEWPDAPRVASGVPKRVDRLRGIGNSVVPQVAQHIGHLIISDYEDQEGE